MGGKRTSRLEVYIEAAGLKTEKEFIETGKELGRINEQVSKLFRSASGTESKQD